MSRVAVFSNDDIERYLTAGDRSHGEQLSDPWSFQADRGFQANSVTSLAEPNEQLIEAYRKPSRFASYDYDWECYGGRAPNQGVLETAQNVLGWLSLQVETSYQATGVTFLDERNEWLIEAFKKLSRFATLEDDWDSYGAQAPNQGALDKARDVLRLLSEADFEPTSVDPSAEGGVCLSFHQDDRYGDIECFNSGEVLAVTSTGGDETDVWNTKGREQDLRKTLSRIRTFVGS